ncbi:class I SAM-dependent methyltransferase [Streptomyces boninensis]|uniref:class I SAM-dependent methyltransferase n=1 Tax=Streptomyces boninensis TaxID=2039455 RepID=UPI003B22293B
MGSRADAEGAFPGRRHRFDGWAAHYERSQLQEMVYQPVHRKVLARVRRRTSEPARILDVGCGTGRLPRALAECFPHASVIGVDPCIAMINQADVSACPQWLQARAEELPFADAVFDLVVSTLSVRHWGDPRLGLAEISRVAVGGGTVVVADAEIDSGRAAAPHGRRRRTGPGRVYRWAVRSGRRSGVPTSRACLAYEMRRAGLSTEKVELIDLALASITLITAAKAD